VSRTANAITCSDCFSGSAARNRSASETDIRTEPDSVNLNAFDSRFFSTCSTRCPSVKIVRGTSGAMSTPKSSPFCSASGRKVRSTKPASSVIGTSVGVISIFPASTFERSRTSLIRLRRSVPDERIVFAKSTCFGERFASLLSASSRARMSSELSGVRSSCDMFARTRSCTSS
jgi:hypothetical protein